MSIDNNNEIKKTLYRENPLAYLLGVTKEAIDYKSDLADGSIVFFSVPMNDIGDATFYSQMPAKHLIRYINIVTQKD